MSDNYIFNRDLKSITRLNYQHWVTRKICRYLVHPSIPKTGSSIKIADIGAGTGIWSFEAADYFPQDTEFTLFDISNDQYPPANFNTTNVAYEVHDAFQPFPDKFQGSFDVVHIRYFLTLLDSRNIEVFVSNVVQLLKPGGYLQWLEYDMSKTHVNKLSPDTPTPALDQLVASMKKPHPNADHDWLAPLGTTLEKHGLQGIQRDPIEWQRQNIPFISHVSLLTMEDFCMKFERDGNLEQATKFRALFNNMFTEVKGGSAVLSNFIVTIARKPT